MKVAIKTGGGDFLEQPAGLFQAVLVDVVEKPAMPDKFAEGGFRDKLDLRFQSARLITEEDFKEQGKEVREDSIGQPFLYSVRYNVSLHPKSGLGKALKSWGVTLPTSGEFDLDDLIGRNAMLNVVKEESGWVGVQTIMASTAEPIIPSADYVRVQDRDDTSFNHGANVATAAPAGLG